MTIPKPILGSPLTIQVTLDGTGQGVASLGPVRVREHWQLISAAVKVQPVSPNLTPIKNATCDIYVGSSLNPNTFFAHSITGSTGDTCGFGSMDIQPGMQVWAQWLNGDANAVASLTIQGTYTLGSPS